MTKSESLSKWKGKLSIAYSVVYGTILQTRQYTDTPNRSSRHKSLGHIQFWVLCYIQHTGYYSVTSVLSKHEQSEVSLQESCLHESSDDEDINYNDLSPLISCHITPIVTVPTVDKDEAKDSRIPGLEYDEQSSEKAEAEPSISLTYVEPTNEEIEQWLDETDTETDGVWPSFVEDEEEPQRNWSIWDSPSQPLGKRI